MDKTRCSKSLVIAQVRELYEQLFEDLSLHHPDSRTELSKDFAKLFKRSESEGISVFTELLPTFGKAVYRSFETGRFLLPLGFKRKKGTCISLFLYSLMSSVYDDEGYLLGTPDVCCVSDIVQIAFFAYKLDLPFSEDKNSKVINSFLAVERELRTLTLPHQYDWIAERCSELIADILKDCDPMDILPKHGPGSVATGEKLHRKWKFKRKFNAIHKVFPYYEYFVPSRTSLLDRISWYKSLMACESGCARVVLVPKDSRGPRLISMEPLEYQFIQQGLKTKLYERLESHPLTAGRLNFTLQSINQNLARISSIKGTYSTLDMKEASDRVSLQLVERLFAKVPNWLKALKASRTTHTELPDGRALELFKFAPMGSAVCFPIEALIFWSIGEVLRREWKVKEAIYVYGDDIIVPKEITSDLIDIYEAFGLRVNVDKSFTTGPFRESCGYDCFNGEVITPTRMKKLLPLSRRQLWSAGDITVAAIDLSNRLWKRGYWKTSSYLKRLVNLDLLVTDKPFKSLQWFCFTGTDDTGLKSRYNSRYQTKEYYQPDLFEAKNPNENKSWSRLFENLCSCLTRLHPIPHCGVKLRMRWTLPY